MTRTKLKKQRRHWRMSGDDAIIDGYDTILKLWKGGLHSPLVNGRRICKAVNETPELLAVEACARSVVTTWARLCRLEPFMKSNPKLKPNLSVAMTLNRLYFAHLEDALAALDKTRESVCPKGAKPKI